MMPYVPSWVTSSGEVEVGEVGSYGGHGPGTVFLGAGWSLPSSAGQRLTPFSLFQLPITTSTSSSSFSQVSPFDSLSCNMGG